MLQGCLSVGCKVYSLVLTSCACKLWWVIDTRDFIKNMHKMNYVKSSDMNIVV